MKPFFSALCTVCAGVLLTSCSAVSTIFESEKVIDAKRGGIIETPEQVMRGETDYMTYLRLKKAAGPMDQDYILLSGRLVREMARDELFVNSPERVKIALRDVLNYHPTAEIRPAIIHEYTEHALMNTRAMWVVDGSTPYEYVLDVELSEVPSLGDNNSESKALAVMLVLFKADGTLYKEWFGVLKREKGGKAWY